MTPRRVLLGITNVAVLLGFGLVMAWDARRGHYVWVAIVAAATMIATTVFWRAMKWGVVR